MARKAATKTAETTTKTAPKKAVVTAKEIKETIVGLGPWPEQVEFLAKTSKSKKEFDALVNELNDEIQGAIDAFLIQHDESWLEERLEYLLYSEQ